jgi:hypothetical protein
MNHWWNDYDRGKPKYLQKNPSQCHFVHHKSHMAYPTIPVCSMNQIKHINKLCMQNGEFVSVQVGGTYSNL